MCSTSIYNEAPTSAATTTIAKRIPLLRFPLLQPNIPGAHVYFIKINFFPVARLPPPPTSSSHGFQRHYCILLHPIWSKWDKQAQNRFIIYLNTKHNCKCILCSWLLTRSFGLAHFHREWALAPPLEASEPRRSTWNGPTCEPSSMECYFGSNSIAVGWQLKCTRAKEHTWRSSMLHLLHCASTSANPMKKGILISRAVFVTDWCWCL